LKNLDLKQLFLNVDAVIFDMDGTLIDSLYVWSEIDVEFLGNHGINPPPSDYGPAISGMSFLQVAEYTKDRFALSESIADIMNTWNEMAEMKYSSEVQYKPYAEEFLKLCNKNKFKMGIATSNSRFLVEKLINRLKLDEYMDVIITGDEVINGKPAPDIYLHVAKLLGVKPERCLVFEDVPAGIEAGKRAGMKVCAVCDKATMDVDDIKRELADYYIESYEITN